MAIVIAPIQFDLIKTTTKKEFHIPINFSVYIFQLYNIFSFREGRSFDVLLLKEKNKTKHLPLFVVIGSGAQVGKHRCVFIV